MIKKYKNVKKVKTKKALMSKKEFYAYMKDFTKKEIDIIYDWTVSNQHKL